MNSRTRLVLRWIVSLALLAWLGWQLDSKAVLDVLVTTSPWLFLPALLLVLLQITVSAWRWRFTARCLGLALPLRLAFREYYLGTFLNQVLPGGVAGDLNRAWRQGLHSGERLAALHSVIIERLSGQLVLAVVALLSVLLLLPELAWLKAWRGLPYALAVAAAGAMMLILMLRHRLAVYFSILRRDLQRALFRWPTLLIQIASSGVVLLAYLGVFVLLAAAQPNWAGTGSVVLLLALCTLLLLAMVVPLTIAGWGVREGVAAVLWPLAGLPAEQGVALSIGYGMVNLLCSLPGGLALVSEAPRARRRNSGQTACQSQD